MQSKGHGNAEEQPEQLIMDYTNGRLKSSFFYSIWKFLTGKN